MKMIKNKIMYMIGLLGIVSTYCVESSVIEHAFANTPISINYVQGIGVPKFDASLGTLDKIEFVLTGKFTGSSRTENLSPTTVSITLNNSVKFKQTVMGGPVLFDKVVSRVDVFNALAWDGGFPPDWAGTSGKEFLFLTEVRETFFTEKDDPASLALFTGIGNINIPVNVTDVSTTSMSGPNIVASQFINNTSLESMVRYYYTPVPEPKVYGYIGMGICGIMLILFHKRR